MVLFFKERGDNPCFPQHKGDGFSLITITAMDLGKTWAISDKGRWDRSAFSEVPTPEILELWCHWGFYLFEYTRYTAMNIIGNIDKPNLR